MDAGFMLKLGVALAVIAATVSVAMFQAPRASGWRKLWLAARAAGVTLWLSLLLLASEDSPGSTSAGGLVFPFFAGVLFWISAIGEGMALLLGALWNSSKRASDTGQDSPTDNELEVKFELVTDAAGTEAADVDDR